MKGNQAAGQMLLPLPLYICNVQYDLHLHRQGGKYPPYREMKRVLCALSFTKPEQVQKSSYVVIVTVPPARLEVYLKRKFPMDKIVVTEWHPPQPTSPSNADLNAQS